MLEIHVHDLDYHQLFIQMIFCLLKIFFQFAQILEYRAKSFILRKARPKLRRRPQLSCPILLASIVKVASNQQLESLGFQKYLHLLCLFELKCLTICLLQSLLVFILVLILSYPIFLEKHLTSPSLVLQALFPYN